MRIVASVLAVLTLVSCASAPPSPEEIHQKVVTFLGEPLTPEAPQPEIVVEPTRARWTIFRAEAESLQNGSQGQVTTTQQPLEDGLLGINFGHGLFLDSQGNLAILPLALWPDYWKPARYDARVTQTLWINNGAKAFGVERTPEGLRVYHTGVFGTSHEDFDLQADKTIAFQRKVERNKAGVWWETNAVQLLEAVQAYQKVNSGITHTVKHFFDSSVTYTYDDKGVDSTDKSFSLVVEGDHWTVQLGKKVWWLFWGAGKALLIDTRTGDTALMSQTPEGALLTSSGGNQESMVINTK